MDLSNAEAIIKKLVPAYIDYGWRPTVIVGLDGSVSTWERTPPTGRCYFEHKLNVLNHLLDQKCLRWKCNRTGYALVDSLPRYDSFIFEQLPELSELLESTSVLVAMEPVSEADISIVRAKVEWTRYRAPTQWSNVYQEPESHGVIRT